MPGAMYIAQTTEMFRSNEVGQGLIDELKLPATVFPVAGRWNQFQSMTKVERDALRLNTAGSPPLASTTIFFTYVLYPLSKHSAALWL
jgi:hypothetical protein